MDDLGCWWSKKLASGEVVAPFTRTRSIDFSAHGSIRNLGVRHLHGRLQKPIKMGNGLPAASQWLKNKSLGSRLKRLKFHKLPGWKYSESKQFNFLPISRICSLPLSNPSISMRNCVLSRRLASCSPSDFRCNHVQFLNRTSFLTLKTQWATYREVFT